MKLIYKITNTKSNKVYIGCSKRGVEKRYLEHLQNFHNESKDSHFYKNLRLEKIDEGDLTVDIIEYLSEQTLDSEMLKIESGWINYYRDILDFRNVYNVQTIKEPTIINDNIIIVDTEYNDITFFDFSLVEKKNKLNFCKMNEDFLIRIDEVFHNVIGDKELYQGKTLYRIGKDNYINIKDIVFHPMCKLNIFKELDKSEVTCVILYEYLKGNTNFKNTREPFSIYSYDSEILLNKGKNTNTIAYNGTLSRLKICTDINYSKLIYILKEFIRNIGESAYKDIKDLIFIIKNFREHIKKHLSEEKEDSSIMIQEDKIKEDSLTVKESSDDLVDKIYKLGKIADSIEESLHCTREIALDIAMEVINEGEDKLFDIIRNKLM